MPYQQDRLSVSVLKHLSEIIAYEVKNPDIGFVTITGVDASADGSYAKVYVTFLASKDPTKNLKALDRTKGFLRTQLAKRLAKRIVPELTFLLDTSYDDGSKIDNILKAVNKNEQRD